LGSIINMKKFVITVVIVVILAASSAFWIPYLPFANNKNVATDENEAILYLTPQKGTYKAGDDVSVVFRLSSSDSIISLLTGIKYDPSLIEIKKINKDGSIFLSWWEEVVDKESGVIRLQASLPSPGFKGTDGLIAIIEMRVLKEGELVLTYDPFSLVLKGDDSNILSLAKSIDGKYSLKSSSSFIFPFFQ